MTIHYIECPIKAIFLAKYYEIDFDLIYFKKKTMEHASKKLFPSAYENKDGLIDADGKLHSSTDLAILCDLGTFNISDAGMNKLKGLESQIQVSLSLLGMWPIKEDALK